MAQQLQLLITPQVLSFVNSFVFFFNLINTRLISTFRLCWEGAVLSDSGKFSTSRFIRLFYFDITDKTNIGLHLMILLIVARIGSSERYF